ncbi:hypothetical protein [Spiroplasma endosymbiont of Polydrusus formosus]|uniref:hypothetical protein n=1 Tax=Spiroplasma endosymbiont of Polydrusus formosus TaxID=3139326 RepID=UPI0035B53F36
MDLVKLKLFKLKKILSYREKIRQIMIKNQLVSKYTKLKYCNHKLMVNNNEISNVLNREFN